MYRWLTSYLAFGLCDFRVPLSSRSRPFLSAVGNYYPILRLTAFFGLQKHSGLNREQDSWRSWFLFVLYLLSGTRISCGTQPGREEPHRCLEMEPGLGEGLCGKARKTLRACKSQMRETDVLIKHVWCRVPRAFQFHSFAFIITWNNLGVGLTIPTAWVMT